MKIITNLRGNIIVIIIDFQLKINNEFNFGVNEHYEVLGVNKCYGVNKDPNENDYLLVFEYAKNGDLHNNLSKNFKEITWENKIESLYYISLG